MKTYYDKEFQQLGALPATMKLINENGQTRWITVTAEEIKFILEILNKKEVTA